ncbi:PrsW family glutamic-type intramembrane protease [Methanobacterium sp.]|uniref:PrsW family glutamic-type intramembrane protease n=1 Tax=Methanobacterium sp. TaxID=2164 RepID=UPI0031586752
MRDTRDDKTRFHQDNLIIEPHRPNLKEKLFFLLSGIIVSIPITLLFGSFTRNFLDVFPSFFASLISIIIFTPFIEEFAKAYPLFYRHGETERSIFILGFLVGLGFGITEFILYVFVLNIPVIVRLPGILFHASVTSIVAYGIAKKQPLKFYLIAVGLHILNNFSAMIETGDIGVIVANVGAYYLCLMFYFKTTEQFIDGSYFVD